MSEKIDALDPKLAAYHAIWKQNRDVVGGARTVRANARIYLPNPITDEPDRARADRAFAAYVRRVGFFPGAARTADGLVGLMFRKAPTVIAPVNLQPMLDTITADGLTLSDLAETLAAEMLITNFSGLVTDYPAVPEGVSLATAINEGYRPFIAHYQAESILGIEVAVINNRVRPVRVRLWDDANTIRELRLDQGVYTVTKWVRQDSGTFVVADTVTPLKQGKPIDEIPFTLVTTGRTFAPVKSALEDICDLNLQHYVASANLATAHYYASTVIYTIAGVAEDAVYSVAPGTVWQFKESTVKAEILEYSGSAITALKAEVDAIADRMAASGSRILAAEKASAESGEALAIRNASENARNASLTRTLSRKLNDALAWVAWWLDLPEDAITFEANTDFNAIPLDPQDLTARVALWQQGVISKDALLDILIGAEVLPEGFDREADAQRISEETADSPPRTDFSRVNEQ